MGAPSVIAKPHSLRVMSCVNEVAVLALSLGRAEILISARVMWDEHFKRDGLGAVTDEKVLGALLNAPKETLSPVDASFSRVASAQFVTLVEDPAGGLWAASRIGNPLEILQVEIQAATWKVGSSIAHDWAGYAPRTVRLPARDGIDPAVLCEADHYDIGVTYERSPYPELEAGEFTPARWSSARWLVSELLYEELLRSESLS